MKRTAILALAALLLAASLVLPAAAYDSQRQLDLVTDDAGLLSDAERSELESRAEALSAQYDCDICIVTVDDFTRYGGSAAISDFTEYVYNAYTLGAGGDRSCVVLALSMAARDYDLMAHGYANVAFTDYGKGVLEDQFLPALGDDDWYKGFSAYLEGCGKFLDYAEKGTPVDTNFNPYDRFTAGQALITVVICLLPALLAVLIMRRKMKSAVPQREASAYIPEGGVSITQSGDVFLHTDVQRVRIQKSDSGGGGGTTVNSGGFSHSSGKF